MGRLFWQAEGREADSPLLSAPILLLPDGQAFAIAQPSARPGIAYIRIRPEKYISWDYAREG